MFRFILRLTLPILILCTILSALAPRIAPRPVEVSAEWSEFGFAVCDLPCWAGITVGETPAADLLPLVQANIPTLMDYNITVQQLYIWNASDQSRSDAIISYSPGYAELITLNLYAPPNHLVDLLGMPDCVTGVRNLFFGTDYILTWMGDKGVTAGMFGELVDLFSGKHVVHVLVIDMYVGQMSCEQYGAIPFRGIAPWWRYSDWINEQAD